MSNINCDLVYYVLFLVLTVKLYFSNLNKYIPASLEDMYECSTLGYL